MVLDEMCRTDWGESKLSDGETMERIQHKINTLRPGAHPTNNILMEFEIQPKFEVV